MPEHTCPPLPAVVGDPQLWALHELCLELRRDNARLRRVEALARQQLFSPADARVSVREIMGTFLQGAACAS